MAARNNEFMIAVVATGRIAKRQKRMRWTWIQLQRQDRVAKVILYKRMKLYDMLEYDIMECMGPSKTFAGLLHLEKLKEDAIMRVLRSPTTTFQDDNFKIWPRNINRTYFTWS